MVKLTEEHWLYIQPFLPPQTRLGRKHEHDREVLNSLVYRLKTGCRYRDIPRTPECAAPSTTFYWFKRWAEQGLFKRIWQALLSLLDSIGEIDLSKGSLDGSFVPGKRGPNWSTGEPRAMAPRSCWSVRHTAFQSRFTSPNPAPMNPNLHEKP